MTLHLPNKAQLVRNGPDGIRTNCRQARRRSGHQSQGLVESSGEVELWSFEMCLSAEVETLMRPTSVIGLGI